jgi:3-oxoacyl-[acyl-carrier protein] reductase
MFPGSSSGIGRATALAFSREGGSVLIHGQNVERLADTERALWEANGGARERVAKVAGSLEDPATAEKIIAEAIAKFGGIDVLVSFFIIY